jgi:RNA polymerase sigma-70 factor (ECF subfamily)
MHTTSVSLLERLHAGRAAPDAWERFVSLYTPLLLAWARRLSLPDADAADLVQDVFTRLVDQLPRFRYDPGRSFRGWLRTLTVNVWRQRARRRVPPAPVGAADQVAVPDPAEAFWEAEYQQHLARRALAVMRADFQTATWRAFWETVVGGKPAPRVAAELGVTVGAVYAAKVRVLARLRAELAGLME